jgi:hypothetical protein
MAMNRVSPRLPVFPRLIRFAKVVALVANAWTLFYVVLIVAWQITSLFREGLWPSLRVSSVIKMMGYERDVIYVTASARTNDFSVVDMLLCVPVVAPLLLASALLTAFYLWLVHTEHRHSRN